MVIADEQTPAAAGAAVPGFRRRERPVCVGRAAPGRARVEPRRATALLTLAAGVALAEGVEACTGLRAESSGRTICCVGAASWPASWPRPRTGSMHRGSRIRHQRDQRPRIPRSSAIASRRSRPKLGRRSIAADVLAETLAALARGTATCSSGRFDAILDAWRPRAPSSRGARVTWTDADRPRIGRHGRHRRHGALLVRTAIGSSGSSRGSDVAVKRASHGVSDTYEGTIAEPGTVTPPIVHTEPDTCMSLMLLAIDVGNTNIVLGVFDGATLVQSWRLQTLRERTADELGLLVDGLFAHSRIDRSQDPRRRPRLGRAAADRHDCADGRALLRRDRRSSSIRRATPACRSCTRIPPKSAPTGSSTRSRRTSSTARDGGRPLIVVRLRHRDDARCGDARRASIWAARSVPASRFRPTRCSSAPRGCRASTCASRRRSSAARRSARWSRGCSTAMSAWSKGWCGG